MEVAKADDVDFIGQNYADINKIQEVLKKKKQLKVNLDKTKYKTMQIFQEVLKKIQA